MDLLDAVRKTITLYHSQASTELPMDVADRLYKVLELEE